jgi:hypothetical protein
MNIDGFHQFMQMMGNVNIKKNITAPLSEDYLKALVRKVTPLGCFTFQTRR